MADVVGAARRFRERARQRTRTARVRLASVYDQVVSGVRRDSAPLRRRVERLRDNHVEPTQALLEAPSESTQLAEHAEERLTAAAEVAFELADKARQPEAREGFGDAQQITGLLDRAGLVRGIDEVAVMQLVDNLDRGPLRDLLRERARRDADEMRRLMVDGLSCSTRSPRTSRTRRSRRPPLARTGPARSRCRTWCRPAALRRGVHMGRRRRWCRCWGTTRSGSTAPIDRILLRADCRPAIVLRCMLPALSPPRSSSLPCPPRPAVRRSRKTVPCALTTSHGPMPATTKANTASTPARFRASVSRLGSRGARRS